MANVLLVPHVLHVEAANTARWFEVRIERTNTSPVGSERLLVLVFHLWCSMRVPCSSRSVLNLFIACVVPVSAEFLFY